ncbi:MAG TPA: lysozyme inhibitor LprI family protein [Pyrinomonadaceae bacterium]|nr:lysozyme inhibitor LprI family protein [Pyrinomonadaceae bacterium]
MSKKFGAGVFALLLLFFCAGAARAQEDALKTAAQQPPATVTQDEQDDADREDPCPGANTQPELNQCAARARDKADAELNEVYRELLKNTSGAERARLRAAQLAWIKFRDAQCDYESVGNKGGSIYPMVYSFCLAKLTNTRVRQLQEILREGSER